MKMYVRAMDGIWTKKKTFKINAYWPVMNSSHAVVALPFALEKSQPDWILTVTRDHVPQFQTHKIVQWNLPSLINLLKTARIKVESQSLVIVMITFAQRCHKNR
jgi:hypothetical protein